MKAIRKRQRNKAMVIAILSSVISANLICSVLADELSDITGLNAGAGTILSNDVATTDRVSAGADKAEDVATVTNVSNDENDFLFSADDIAEGKGPARLEEDDPLFELYGNDIIMSNVMNSVNVRTSPNEEAEIAGKMYHNCAGEMLDRDGEWTEIRSGDLTGWVKNDYLIIGQEAVELAKQAGAMMATVKTESLRIRELADEDSAIYGLLGEGDKIEVVEQTDGWMKVAYSDDSEGYISGDYVSLEYEIDEGETMEAIAAREERERLVAEKKRKAEEAAKAKSKNASSKTSVTNNGAVASGADDVTLLAALIQAECGREPYAGKLAVGAVVVNRARGRYGSIAKAIYAPGQFGPAASGKVDAIAAIGPTAECRNAAAEAIAGNTNIGSATQFRNVRSGYSGIVIGNHVFW